MQSFNVYNLPYQALPYKISVGLVCSLVVSGIGWAADLPVRQTAIPETTNSVPHVQIDIEPVAEYSSELVRRIDALPGVHVQATSNSLAGAKGFRLQSYVSVANPRSLLGGREFAHLHKDGSLHAFLPPELAKEAISKNWGTWHPWAGQNPGWDGFIMIFTPGSEADLNTVTNLVKTSYEFVTGQSPTDLSPQTATGDTP